MPKIIENLESRLIEEAIKQINANGYGAVTIRSVANACGVGVGTVYNYFSSKDDLLAAYLLQDWNVSMDTVKTVGAQSSSPMTMFECMYNQIQYFSRRYSNIFQDPEAVTGFSSSYTRHHKILRSQLADPVRTFFMSDFAADFAAEAMLTWTFSGKSFEEIYGMIQKLL